MAKYGRPYNGPINSELPHVGNDPLRVEACFYESVARAVRQLANHIEREVKQPIIKINNTLRTLFTRKSSIPLFQEKIDGLFN